MPQYPQFIEKNIGETKLFLTPLERNSTAMQLSFDVGSFMEEKNNAGISHLLEHILGNGSKKYPTQKLIAEAVKKYGGHFNAFTSVTETGFWIYTPASAINETLDILFDIVFNPIALFKNSEIEKEKRIIIQEIKMHKDEPDWQIAEFANQTLNPNHKIAIPIAGFEKTVAKINQETLANWWKKYYLPSNLKIAIAGFIPKNLENKIEQFIPISNKKIEINLPEYSAIRNLRIAVHPKQLDQVKLILAFEQGGKITPKEMITAELLSYILGSRMGSLLTEELRVKEALCYDVWADTDNFNDFNIFYIGGGFSGDKITKATQKIIDVLNKIKNNKIPNEKFEEAKSNYLGNLEMKCDDTAGLPSWPLFDFKQFGRVLGFKETIKILNSINKNEVDNLVEKLFFSKNAAVTTLGPYKDDNKIKEILEKLN